MLLLGLFKKSLRGFFTRLQILDPTPTLKVTLYGPERFKVTFEKQKKSSSLKTKKNHEWKLPVNKTYPKKTFRTSFQCQQ